MSASGAEGLFSLLAAAPPLPVSLSPCLLVSLSPCLGVFPRGGGFYFDLVKLLLIVGVYLLWVRLCWWVDQDARELKLKPPLWNGLVLLGGLLGLLLVW